MVPRVIGRKGWAEGEGVVGCALRVDSARGQ